MHLHVRTHVNVGVPVDDLAPRFARKSQSEIFQSKPISGRMLLDEEPFEIRGRVVGVAYPRESGGTGALSCRWRELTRQVNNGYHHFDGFCGKLFVILRGETDLIIRTGNSPSYIAKVTTEYLMDLRSRALDL
jgi:hypothetical protein